MKMKKGGLPTPKIENKIAIPWKERKENILLDIYKRGKRAINTKHCPSLQGNYQEAKDLKKLVKNDYLKVSLIKAGGPRSGYRTVKLTEKGEKYLIDKDKIKI